MSSSLMANCIKAHYRSNISSKTFKYLFLKVAIFEMVSIAENFTVKLTTSTEDMY